MEKVKNKVPTGTKEWASSNVNIINGCSHNCAYCYAKKMAIRFNRKSKDNWKDMELNDRACSHNFKKRKGRIMFPSSHDIVPKFKEECFQVLNKLICAGNSVLITTKPHFDVIKDLCDSFIQNKNLIQFRFTITSINNDLLHYWEEGAPLFEERLKSLKYAYEMEFKTSVSIEPFLDKNPIPLIEKISPYVTETIWLGKMNYIQRNNLKTEDERYFLEIRQNNSLENIKYIVD